MQSSRWRADVPVMGGRIVILSDTHLGRPRCAARTAQALRPLWRDAACVIVNGDVAELHHPRHGARAEQEVLALHECCAADGVALTLLSGNHDPFISDLRHVHIGDDLIFVTHGDALHPAIAPWSPVAPRVRQAYERALSMIDPEDRDHLEARLAVSRYAAAHECQYMRGEAIRSTIPNMLIRPWALGQVLTYWRIIPRIAANFTRFHCPKAKYMIFGHTHRPGIWVHHGITVINTGSFGFPGRPRAVTIEGRALAVWAVHRRRRDYRLDASPLATYELPARIESPSAMKPEPVSDRAGVAAL